MRSKMMLGAMLVTGAATMSSASVVVVMNETFENPSYSTTLGLSTIPGAPFKREAGSPANHHVVADDSAGIGSGMAMSFSNNSGNQAREILHFTNTPAVVGPNVGDNVKLSFQVRLNGTPANSTSGFRFVLSDSRGTEQGNPYPNAQTAQNGADDDRGLYMSLATGTTAANSPLAFKQLAGNLHAHTFGGLGTMPPGVTNINGTGTYVATTINDQLTHLVEALITRTATGLAYSLSLDNVVVASASATGTSAAFIQQFDQIAFGTGFVEMPNIRIDNITLTQTVIPEPASLSLLALGGLMLGRRRRA